MVSLSQRSGVVSK
jgi:hypothetical protein